MSVSGPFVPKTQPPTVLTEDEIVDRVSAAFLPPNWRSAVCRESIVGSAVVPALASPHRAVSMRYRDERGGTRATE